MIRYEKYPLYFISKAYPFVELAKGSGAVGDMLGSHHILIRYNHNHQSAEVLDTNGKPLPGAVLFWFAWYAFHPETDDLPRQVIYDYVAINH